MISTAAVVAADVLDAGADAAVLYALTCCNIGMCIIL